MIPLDLYNQVEILSRLCIIKSELALLESYCKLVSQGSPHKSDFAFQR